MNFEESGTLSVFTTEASASLPIEGSLVRVFGAAEENRFIDYSLVTDVDGLTEKIELPAPKKLYS